MAGASGKNKNMPDGVMISHSLHHVKNHAQRVAQTAGDNPTHSGDRKCREQWFENNHGEPSHRQIQARRSQRKATGREKLENNATKCKSPDHAKDRPAPHTTQGDEQKWSVGAGDQ